MIRAWEPCGVCHEKGFFSSCGCESCELGGHCPHGPEDPCPRCKGSGEVLIGVGELTPASIGEPEPGDDEIYPVGRATP